MADDPQTYEWTSYSGAYIDGRFQFIIKKSPPVMDLSEPPYMARLADACRRIEKTQRELDVALLWGPDYEDRD